MATINNQARFSINGTPSQDPTTGDRLYAASHGENLTLTLEINPSPATSATFEVFDPADDTSPVASKNAPLLTWTENGLPAITIGPVPFGIDADVNIVMPPSVISPAPNIHSYRVRCTVSTAGDGSPLSQVQVFERQVMIFGLLADPSLRKTTVGETTQARARAWSDSLNDLIDAMENTLVSAGDLQSSYVLGNTIDVSLANGPVQFSSTVAVTQSPLTVRMDAVNVIEVDIAGAINLDPTSGENFDLSTAGGGTVNIFSDGDFDIVSLSPSGAAVQITAALADMDIAAPLGVLAIDAATVDMTALTGDLTIDSTSGVLSMLAPGGTIVIDSGAGAGILIDGLTNLDVEILSDGTGGIAIAAQGTGDAAVVSFAGDVQLQAIAGSVVTNAYTFPTVNVDTFNFPDANGAVNSVLTDALGDGVLSFEPLSFIDLPDTPATYAGQGGLVPHVNDAETALVFSTAGGGGSIILEWGWLTDITDTDPGSGNVKGDNATQANIAQLNISDVTTNGKAMGVLLALLKSGDLLIVSEENDSSRWIVFLMDAASVDQTTYFELPGAVVQNGGAIRNNRTTGVQIFAAGTPTPLQSVYNAGNVIAATAARPIAFSNAVDLTDLLTLDRTFAGAGDGLAVTMGTATTGVGVSIAVDATSDNGSRALDIDFDGTGASAVAFNIDIDAAAGADAMHITHNGSSGALLKLTNPTGDMLDIDADGSISIAANDGGILSLDGDSVTMDASATSVDITANTTIDIAATTVVDITGTSVIVNAYTFPDLLVDTFSWPNVNGDAGSVATDVAGDGVVTFEAPALITGYMVGLHVENSVSPALDEIDIAVGRCRDSTDTYDITLASILSPSLTFVGANGLDTGTRQNSSLYAVYVIDDSSSPGSASLFSLNQTSPALPGSFDKFRRVASVQTNSIGNLDTFLQSKDEGSGRWMFRKKASVLQFNGTATSFTNTSSAATLFAPPSASHFSLDLQAEKSTTSDLEARIEAVPDGWNETGGQYWTSYCGMNTTDQVKASSVMEIPTGPNGLIRYRVFNARATIFFRAYKDQM